MAAAMQMTRHDRAVTTGEHQQLVDAAGVDRPRHPREDVSADPDKLTLVGGQRTSAARRGAARRSASPRRRLTSTGFRMMSGNSAPACCGAANARAGPAVHPTSPDAAAAPATDRKWRRLISVIVFPLVAASSRAATATSLASVIAFEHIAHTAIAVAKSGRQWCARTVPILPSRSEQTPRPVDPWPTDHRSPIQMLARRKSRL